MCDGDVSQKRRSSNHEQKLYSISLGATVRLPAVCHMTQRHQNFSDWPAFALRYHIH